MKEEYDFSKGERGKFFKPGATFNLPVYLDKKNRSYVEKMAQDENVDVSTVVNEFVRRAYAAKKTSSG